MGRWFALWRLAVALVLSMTTWFSASAVIPQLREQWNIGDTAAAWLTIAVQLGFVGGALLSSTFNLADVIAPHRLIFVGALGAAAANVGLLFAGSAGPAIALHALTGAFLAGVYPPALKLIATWFREQRGTAIGILIGALTLGSAMPHLVNATGGLDWERVVMVTSILTGLGGLIALTVVEGPFPFPRGIFDPRMIGRVFSNRGVLLASLGYFGHMWELYAMWAWMVVFFRAVYGTDGSAAALATFATIGVGALGCYVGGVIGDRLGRPRAAGLMMLVSGSCALGIGLLLDSPSWLVLIVALVWGFSVVADSGQFSALVTEVSHQSYVGTAVTLQLAVGFTLTVATIWLIPVFEDLWTWRWAFRYLP
ncbi:MAG: MFS transporter [Actinomycetota bacterium]